MVQILIVDDDEDDRDLLSEAVHEIDPKIQCVIARNGQEALSGLRTHNMPKPNLIFLDLNMPRVNGVQFLRELRKEGTLQDIPVVIYTTSDLSKDKDECRNLGAVHFITKPSNFSGICRAISKVFSDEMILPDSRYNSQRNDKFRH